MKHSFYITGNHYLAATTVISIGVLSGCEYCIPLLMVALFASTMHFMKQAITGNRADNSNLSYNN